MTLNEYLNTHEKGCELAVRLGVPTSSVSNWKNKKRPVPIYMAINIERATNGLVSCEELRPDVDWNFLRGTKKAA